jgi:hypothetical protein
MTKPMKQSFEQVGDLCERHLEDKLNERRRCKSIGFIVRFLEKIIPDGGALTHYT